MDWLETTNFGLREETLSHSISTRYTLCSDIIDYKNRMFLKIIPSSL